MNSEEFLNIHKNKMELLGFWDEEYTASLKRMLESKYHH